MREIATMNVARSWLVAACALVPSLAAANGQLAATPVVTLAPVAGMAVGAVPLLLPVSGELARAIQPATLAGPALTLQPLTLAGEGRIAPLATTLASPQASLARQEKGSIGTLSLGARHAVTFEGSREYWDQGRRALGSLAVSVGRAAEPAVRPNLLGRPAEAAAATAEPAVERTPGRWQRMKAETKQDFRALFANLRELRRSLRLPTSKEAIGSNFRAAGKFFSEVRRLGWKVIGAVILYYLIRDSILYILIPYLVLNGVFR